MRQGLITVVVGLAVVLAAVPQAQAGLYTVAGTNTELASLSGKLYIPFTGATSGTLGDSLGGGQRVGYQPETVVSYTQGEAFAGFVSLVLTYNLSPHLDPANPGMVLNRSSLNVILNFTDIDFVKDVYTNWDYIDKMDLTFLRDPTDAPGPEQCRCHQLE